MARDYPRIHDYYVQMKEVQPPLPNYHQYIANHTSAAQAYQLTASTAASFGGPQGSAHYSLGHHQTVGLMPHVPQYHHDPRKKKTHPAETYTMANGDNMMASSSTSTYSGFSGSTRKRKPSSYGTASTYDDDGTDDSRSTNRTIPAKKQNHSEIEKRRRDKMNRYITELSAIIPMCGAISRKLDKLTVLRMAVQHMRSVRGTLSAGPLTVRPRPAFLLERELNAMVLNTAHDSFLLVVGCDRGRLVYVSTSVSRMLHYQQSELHGQSLFDILHPKDVAKVKEQLSSSDMAPRERLIDAKTMLPVRADAVADASRLCTGARRSFFCRIKCRAQSAPATVTSTQIKEEAGSSKMGKKHNEKKYCVVQCTGYLKSWSSMVLEGGGATDVGEDGDVSNIPCLVAVGRAFSDMAPVLYQEVPTSPLPPARHLQYMSRHATDGKFIFVDQRVTLALGFLPQELLGTSLYEYVSASELGVVARTHKAALLRRDPKNTQPYFFRRKDGSLARIITLFKPFKNPWTKEIDYLVAKNTVVSDSYNPNQNGERNIFDIYNHKIGDEGGVFPYDIADAITEGDAEMQRLIDSQVESHKIGSAIAEEVLRRASTDYSSDMPPDMLNDVFNPQVAYDGIFGGEPLHPEIRNNVTLNAAAPVTPPPTGPMEGPSSSTPPPISPPLPSLGLDGNGEAAMAVIMSLLEADAGLGGPVNFSGLPWPLP